MALFTRSEPAGIDKPLDKLQKDFFYQMRGKWGLLPEDWDCYPRCYRNATGDGYVAEVQTVGGRYQDVYQDSSKAVVSFFGMGERIEEVDTMHKVDVHLVMFCNLVKLYPDAISRPDEQVRLDVYNYFRECSTWGFRYGGMVIGLERCLEEYPGTRRKEMLLTADMHPAHVFRCNLSLSYSQ